MAKRTFSRRLSAAMRGFLDPDCIISAHTLRQDIAQELTRKVSAQLDSKSFSSRVAQNAAEGAEQAIKDMGLNHFQAEAQARRQLLTAYQHAPPRRARFLEVVTSALTHAGRFEGRMLEIGARHESYAAALPGFDYQTLDLKPHSQKNAIIADITNCPELASKQYDLIISHDVFEHIAKPWLAAAEITRLLKPGGVSAHTTLFAWRYHPCPIDYWRFSPQGFASLFDQLKTLHAAFDTTERRRDIKGTRKFPVDEDILGGFRENIRIHYAGILPDG